MKLTILANLVNLRLRHYTINFFLFFSLPLPLGHSPFHWGTGPGWPRSRAATVSNTKVPYEMVKSNQYKMIPFFDCVIADDDDENGDDSGKLIIFV